MLKGLIHENEILSAVFLFSFAGLVTFSGYTESISDTPAITIPVASEPISTDKTSATKKTGTKPIVATANQSIGKIMVLDFPLDELTDLPNPPEELARIAHFNHAFKQKLAEDGVALVPVNDKIKTLSATQSATYLFDHTDIAASLAEGSGADYILVGVAMKPTYLFVYPRLLLVDIKTKRKAFTAYVQMEGSWLDKEHTASSAKNLAKKVSSELKQKR